jgi:hypothetical protein
MEEVKFDSYAELVENYDELVRKLMKKSRLAISVVGEKNKDLEDLLKDTLVNQTKFNLRKKSRMYARKFWKYLQLAFLSYLVSMNIELLLSYPILHLGLSAMKVGSLIISSYYGCRFLRERTKKIDVIFTYCSVGGSINSSVK